MFSMKENDDWPSNELTNQFEKELQSGKMILPKSRIKYYVENLGESFIWTFTDEPAIAKLNNADKDWTLLLNEETVQEELQKKLLKLLSLTQKNDSKNDLQNSRFKTLIKCESLSTKLIILIFH